MTIKDYRNKDRFWNWQLCSVWNLPLCHDRTTSSCTIAFALPVCAQSPWSAFRHLWIIPPKYLIVSTCWSIMLLTCYLQRTLTCVSGATKCIALFSANFHSGFVILSRKPIKCMLNTVFRVCKQYHITCNMQTVDPATSKRKPSSTGFEYLSNSY